MIEEEKNNLPVYKGIIEEITNREAQYGRLWNITIHGKKFGYFSDTFDCSVGDEITFGYEEKNGYLTIKYFLDVRNTHYEPTKEDIEAIKQIFIMDEKMINAVLLGPCIEYGMKKNWEESEIIAMFKRMKELIK